MMNNSSGPVKYQSIQKPNIEVMRFTYNTECLSALNAWLGDDMGKSGKERHIAALGWVEVGNLKMLHGVRYVAFEGEYIIKEQSGRVYSFMPDGFEKLYEPIGETE